TLFRSYINAGKLAPMPEEVTSLLQDDAYAAFEEDGNVYTVPSTANNGEIGLNIIYDKDYFEENGLEVPETYDDFIDLMDDIQANGDVPLATAAGEVWPSDRSEEHTSELQSRFDIVCRLQLEKTQ